MLTESHCKTHNLNLHHILQEGYFEKLPPLNFLDFKYMLECYEEDIAEASGSVGSTITQDDLDETADDNYQRGWEESTSSKVDKLEEQVELLEKLLKENEIEY